MTEINLYVHSVLAPINCFILRFMFEFAEFCNKFVSSEKIQVKKTANFPTRKIKNDSFPRRTYILHMPHIENEQHFDIVRLFALFNFYIVFIHIADSVKQFFWLL